MKPSDMLTCTVISSDKSIAYDNLQSLSLPAYYGQMQIFAGHAEEFVLLNRGEIILKQIQGQKQRLEIEKAECHIKNDQVIVIL